MKSNKENRVKTIFYSICIVLTDQISKHLVLIFLGFDKSKNIIPNLLNFTLVKNEGAAFSLFSNSSNILAITSLIASLLLVSIVLKYPRISYWNLTGLTYLLGGTVGNGIDRFLKGYVLDFINLVPINFPIFNIADMAINIAIICFIIDIIKTKDKTKIKY